jgi:hypothetical protein
MQLLYKKNAYNRLFINLSATPLIKVLQRLFGVSGFEPRLLPRRLLRYATNQVINTCSTLISPHLAVPLHLYYFPLRS